MARRLPFVPRFYIDEIQYNKSIGMLDFNKKNYILSEQYPNISEQFNQTREPYEMEAWNVSGGASLSDDFGIPNGWTSAGSYMKRIRILNKLFDLNPSNFFQTSESLITEETGLSNEMFTIGIPTFYRNEHDAVTRKYFGILGHNLQNTNYAVQLRTNSGFNANDTWGSQDLLSGNNGKDIINGFNEYGFTNYNGFSLIEFNGSVPNEQLQIRIGNPFDNPEYTYPVLGIGSFTYGTIYEPPHSPSLSLSISYEFGNDEKETRGGSSISNTNWFQKPIWVNESAWELNKALGGVDYFSLPEKRLKQRVGGRRIYNLEFTYLSDSDIFATNPNLSEWGMSNIYHKNFENLSQEISGGQTVTISEDDDNPYDLTLMNDNSMFAQLVQKTAGFSLPFIFQPNKDDNRASEFMLAKVDSSKGWAVEQIAPNLFRIELTIKEVW